MYYTKITHHLLSRIEKYLLKEYIIYLYIFEDAKETNRLALCTCVRSDAPIEKEDCDMLGYNVVKKNYF